MKRPRTPGASARLRTGALVRGDVRPARSVKLTAVARRPAVPGVAASPLRVLGLDPGTLRLGYGVIEISGPTRMRYLECGVLSAPASRSRTDRLGIIGRHLCELFDELKPDSVGIEEAFYGRNVQSTLALGEARGMAIYVAADRGLTVTGYPPATVKQAVVGHGRAGKDQVAAMVRTLLGLRRSPESDAADALAIAICHARAALHAARIPVRRAIHR